MTCSQLEGVLFGVHKTTSKDEKYTKINEVVNDEVLNNLDKIKVYPIKIKTEQDLVRGIARIANLSLLLGYKLEDEGRLLSKEEAYQ